MSKYVLFRGDILVDKTDHSTSLDAGNLHDLGQPGDILVCIEYGRLMRFAWSRGRVARQEHYWVPKVTNTKTEAKYRMLILMQT